jgi:hypothetical protein
LSELRAGDGERGEITRPQRWRTHQLAGPSRRPHHVGERRIKTGDLRVASRRASLGRGGARGGAWGWPWDEAVWESREGAMVGGKSGEGRRGLGQHRNREEVGRKKN